MESQHDAILGTLVGVAKHHNKPYCFVSQDRILELLERYHSWNISRRTLNRRLKELEDEGYFVRIRRHIRGSDGRLVMRSTLYKFCGKIFAWIGRVGRWALRLGRVFRVPGLAHNYSLRESKVLNGVSPPKNIIVLKERDGSISRFDFRTGEYLR